MATRPAQMMRSAWRGLKRTASAPKRAMSNREAAVAMNSMPQHAVAKGNGHSEYFRHQAHAGALAVLENLGEPGAPACGRVNDANWRGTVTLETIDAWRRARRPGGGERARPAGLARLA